MPFEPRLLSPDDESWHGDPQSDLPPDLEALAERLRADAAMLAERYPAELSQAGVGPAVLDASIGSPGGRSRRWQTRWWSAAVVAALSVMVLVAGWAAWRVTSPAVDDGERVPETALAADVDRGATAADTVEDNAALDSPSVRPAIRFGRAEALIMNVNGPELEAVLDLLETQGTEDPLLSI